MEAVPWLGFKACHKEMLKDFPVIKIQFASQKGIIVHYKDITICFIALWSVKDSRHAKEFWNKK